MVYQLVLSPLNPASTLLPDTSSQNNIWITFPTLKFSWFTNSFRGGKKGPNFVFEHCTGFQQLQGSVFPSYHLSLFAFLRHPRFMPSFVRRRYNFVFNSMLLIRLFFIVGTKIPVILLTLLIPVTLS